MESGKARAARPLRPEQKTNSLLRKLASPFSQPENLVADLFAGSFSTAMAWLTVLRLRKFTALKAEPQCFRVVKENVLRQFAKAVLDAGTDGDLSVGGTEPAVRVTFLVPKLAISDPL